MPLNITKFPGIGDKIDVTKLPFYCSTVAYGFVLDGVSPYSTDASKILDAIDPYLFTCNYPSEIVSTVGGSHYTYKSCGQPAVRTATFSAEPRKSKEATAFAGLCERHKQVGIWTDQATAWGWD